MSHAANPLKSILYALSANAAIALAKTVGAVLTGSASMQAEALHSFADCGNQALLLWGLRDARRPADADHPMGHGRAIYFWSFIVALMLFSLGGLYSLYEGWHKLHATEPLHAPWVAAAILAFAVVAESFSLWGAVREINKERAGLSLWRWFRTSRQGELIVVFAEDVAALAGLLLAFVFVALSAATGEPVWDAIGSIGIGTLLVSVAVGVAIQIKALLVGQSADPQFVAALRTHLERQPQIAQVYSLITQQLGAEIMVAVKARLHPLASDVALIEAINEVERGVHARFAAVRWIFFEPDLHD